MKYLYLLFLLIPFCGFSQTNEVEISTNSVVPTEISTWGTITSWASSYNTNIDLSKDKLEIYTSLDYVKNVNASLTLGAQIKIYKPISLDVLFRNADIAGTILAEQAGLCYNYTKYDFKLIFGCDIGYRNDALFTYAEPWVEADKATTRINTVFIKLGVDLNLNDFKSNLGKSPLVSLGTKLNF